MKFEWVTSPPAESVLRALEGLVASGMLDPEGRLTILGEKVSECPVEVNIARMVRLIPRHLPHPHESFHAVVRFQGIYVRG